MRGLLLKRFFGLTLVLGAVLVLGGCAGKTTGATNVTEFSATLNATAQCETGQTCTWYWQYWPASKSRSSSSTNTPVQGPVSGASGSVNLSTDITGLQPGTTYRWVFCASPNDGAGYVCFGPHGKYGTTTADPPPDYATFTTVPKTTLAERWNGTSWTVQPTSSPSGAQSSALYGVSCTAATACAATGSYENSAGTTTALGESWNGTSWTIQPTPTPSGATFIYLFGVSCTSATACTAVGSYENSAGTASAPLAERWDGTDWTIQPTPAPSGVPFSGLDGVSCTSATACTAVGDSANSDGTTVTLAESWNGTAWMIQATPAPDQSSDLSGVSCTSATACTAVGNINSIGPLIERWDGTTWAVQTGSAGGLLTGVSCTSGTTCTAVGFTTENPIVGSKPVAEAWNGTSWMTEPISGGQYLSGVSCTSGAACSAVGGSLAEGWDGMSWTVQPTPSPSGTEPSLSAASCTLATACTAVGQQ